MARKSHFVGICKSSSQNTLVGDGLTTSVFWLELSCIPTSTYVRMSLLRRNRVSVCMYECVIILRVRMQHTMWHCGLGGLTNTAIHCKSLQIPVGRTHLKNRGK